MSVRWKTVVMIQSQISFSFGCGRHMRMRISLKMESESEVNASSTLILWVDRYDLQVAVRAKSRVRVDMGLIITNITQWSFFLEKQTPRALPQLVCSLESKCAYACVYLCVFMLVCPQCTHVKKATSSRSTG